MKGGEGGGGTNGQNISTKPNGARISTALLLTLGTLGTLGIARLIFEEERNREWRREKKKKKRNKNAPSSEAVKS